MHNPHNPQSSVNLGDDPDPAAELGPRLAAMSQTVQGLLTNYLFYGQRRSTQGTDRAARAEGMDHAQDFLAVQQGSSTSDRTASVAGIGRTAAQTEGSGSRASKAACPGRTADTGAGTIVRHLEMRPASREAGPAATLQGDALSRDSLADDPLTQDRLSAPTLRAVPIPGSMEDRHRGMR